MAFQAINLSIAQSGRDLSGKYEKGKRIGRGASSDVWYGRLHTDTGDVEIAVKELQVQHYSMQDSSSSQHEYLMKRCLKEVLTVENVKHPNIVPLLGYSIDSLGVPVLITPWYSYGNVIKYLEAQPSANRLALALDAAEGLKYLHSIGLIHGDIHGENLLVDSSGRASLCDLGISQFIEDAILVTGLTTAHANAGGTDRFSSPEILKDQPKTLATDIWAFGCLVAQILTGRIPYGKIVRKYAIHAAINKGELPMENQDGKIGGILWECLKRCWNHEPNFRPMVSEICSHLAGEGLSSTTAQGIEDMGSPHRDDMARLDLSGKVDFGERCNRSGYSDIWRGKLRTNTGVVEIAIKELRIHRSSTSGGSMTQDERLNRRCRREVLLWQKLQHRNIVPLLGFASDPKGVPTLVSPWYVNGNVVEYLNLHPNANRRSLSIDVGSGLEYLHSIGVVHGDLKGENVLVDDDGRASLCDFGMSKFLDEAARITGCTTSHANGGGTNRFFAPELLEDQPKTLETDMWAFGCLIAQILTGCIPYEEITQTMAVIWAINQCQAPMNNQDGKIEGALWNCLVNCWSQAPSDRPSVSQVNQLLKVVEPEPSLLVIPQELERDIIPLDLSGRVDISGRSASGGYSDIYRGTLRTTTEEMEVAIKQLRVLDSSYRKSKTTPAEHHKKRFLREVAVWRDLHHPNIVPLLGYALDSRGTLGLVSPWYPNGNVADYLRSTPSSSTQRASIMRDIANGLAYLHSIPMVHGDLKATNVFVTEGCRASLGDFGMSRILDEALHVHGLTTSQAYTGGTVRYMAPELVIENPKSSASDIWAFGCLVMQIATGTDPYNEQQNTFGVLRAILDGVPPMTNHGEQIGTILWDSLQKCWSMEPANRPTASELCAFLEELEVGPEAKG